MASGRLLVPSWMPALDNNGDPISGVKAYFYVNLTTTLAPVYSDEGLTVPLANPVEANSAGRFPAIWADADVLYSVAIEAPYGPAGVPFSYDNLSTSLGAEIATAEATEAAANDAAISMAAIQAALDAAIASDGSAAAAGAAAGAVAAQGVLDTKTDKESTQFISGLVYNSRAAAAANAVAINAWIASGRNFGALIGGQDLYLTAAPTDTSAIIISGADRFVLRTNGTRLVYAWSSLGDQRKLIDASDSGSIDLGETRIAYDPPCHVQGTVTAVGTGAVDFTPDAGFAPVIPDVAVSITFDPGTETYTRTGGGYDSDLGSVAQVGTSATWRYSPPSDGAGGYKMQPFAVGDRLILLPRKYYYMGVDLYNVADLRGHLIFESSTGFCVAANNIGNMGLTYETNPPPGQIMVSPADGLHLTDIHGGWVEARGEYLGDDVLNVHSRSWTVTSASAGSAVVNASFGDSQNRYPKPARPKVSDLVYIYNADGVIVQTARIVSITGTTAASVVTLDAVLTAGYGAGWKIQTALSAGLNPLSIRVFGRTIHARTALVRRRNVNGSVTSAKTLAQSFIVENVMDSIPEGPVPGEIDLDLITRESWTRLDAQDLPGASGLYAVSITGKVGGATDVTEIRFGRLSMDNHPFGGIGVEGAQVEIGILQIGTGMGSRRSSLPSGTSDAGSRYEASVDGEAVLLIGSVMSGEGGRTLRQRPGNLIAAGSMLNTLINSA